MNAQTSQLMCAVKTLFLGKEALLQKVSGQGFSDASGAASDHYVERALWLSPKSAPAKAIEDSKGYPNARSKRRWQPQWILKNICRI